MGVSGGPGWLVEVCGCGKGHVGACGAVRSRVGARLRHEGVEGAGVGVWGRVEACDEACGLDETCRGMLGHVGVGRICGGIGRVWGGVWRHVGAWGSVCGHLGAARAC